MAQSSGMLRTFGRRRGVVRVTQYVCEWCGTVVTKPFGREGKGRFCTVACAGAYARGKRQPQDHSYRRKRIPTVICDECGIEFQPRQKPRTLLRFHTRECQRRYGKRPRAERDAEAPTLECAQCGVSFYAKPSEIAKGRRFCSDTCYWADRVKLIDRTCKVCDAPYKTRPNRPSSCCSNTCKVDARRKPPITFNCEHCSKAVTTRPSAVGRFCSHRCRAYALSVGKTFGVPAAIRLTKRTPYERPIYKRNAWRVRKRDGYKCQACGLQQSPQEHRLDVHHIIPIRLGGNDKMSNLITLCRACHLRLEGQMRRLEKARLELTS